MRILCIGDSNTWGYNPTNGLRHANRWTKVLATLMPENEIIEEGLNGRTILSKDPIIPERCGISALKLLLMSHKPLDYVVVMLGTNELKVGGNRNINYIADGIEEFINIINSKELWQRFGIPKILIISPVLVRDELGENGNVFDNYDKESVAISKMLAPEFLKICSKYDISFLNAADYAVASLADCIHMDEENHKKLGVAIYKKLIEMDKNK